MAVQGGAFIDAVNTNQAALNTAAVTNPPVAIPVPTTTTGPATFNPSPVVAEVTQAAVQTAAKTPWFKKLLPGIPVFLWILTVVFNAVLTIMSKISIPQSAAIISGATTALAVVKYIEGIIPSGN